MAQARYRHSLPLITDFRETSGAPSEPTIPVSPQAARPAVPEREIGPGGVSQIQGGAGHQSNATPVWMSSWRRSTNGSRKTRPPTAEGMIDDFHLWGSRR